MQLGFPLLVLAALCSFSVNAIADSLVTRAAADTTLIELVPDNNMGGNLFFNAGSNLHGNRNRGLLRFDLAAQLPHGSRIQSAYLVLEVVGVPTDEPVNSNFGLHRMLRGWGEGNKVSGDKAGHGATATIDEATWKNRFAMTTSIWASPGGEEAVDYVSTITAVKFVNAVNNRQYVFGPTPQMTADLQNWLDQPNQNFGWLLKAGDETVTTTARRFAAKEDEDYGPLLFIQFDPPPLLQLANLGSEVHLSFQTRSNESYSVQSSPSLNTNSWSGITNIVGSTDVQSITITNMISENTQFYRLLITQ